jgi:hypothetical protein
VPLLLPASLELNESDPVVTADVGRFEDVLDCKETADEVAPMLTGVLEDGRLVAKGDCTRDETEAVVGDKMMPLPVPL